MTITEKDVRERMSEAFSAINKETPIFHGDLISRATSAYEKSRRTPMSPCMKAILQKTLLENTRNLTQQGKDMRSIQSAAEDPTSAENPISMLFNLISILVPNYAFNEAVGVQPMPSDPSPIFYPQLVANEDRNNIKSGDVLLGSTNWNQNLNFTHSKIKEDLTIITTGTTTAFTASTANMKAGSVRFSISLKGVGDFIVSDDGEGKIPAYPGYLDSGTIDYSTGVVSLVFLANPAADSTGSVTYRYTATAGTKPAQARFEWGTKQVTSERYQIRSSYSLENFYAARQVLADYDIDEAMATSIAGYINAEISENIFDEMASQTDAIYTWDSALSSGVSWATHRLSILQTLVSASNGIRSTVRRSGGNVITADSKLINEIETLGKDIWEPEKYAAEPIGPYLAGKLAGKYKVIKNQNYDEGASVMTFKRSDSDASFISGVFIGLFSTNPLVLDDLTSVSGMGARIGYVKVFENSAVKIQVT